MPKFKIAKLFVIVGARGTAICMAFLHMFLAAKVLNTHDAGVYFAVLSIILGLSILQRRGSDNKIIGVLSEINREENGKKIIPLVVVRDATRLLLIGALQMLVPIFMIGFLSYEDSWMKNYQEYIIFIFGLVLLQSGVSSLAACQKGIGNVSIAAFIETGGIHSVSVVAIYLFSLIEVVSLNYIIYILIFSYVVVFAISLILVIPNFVDNYMVTFDVYKGLDSLLSYRLMIAAIIDHFINSVGVVIIGIASTHNEAAIYSVASKLAGLTNFFIAATNAVNINTLSNMARRNQATDVKRYLTEVRKINMTFAILVSIMLVFIGEYILASIKFEYKYGYSTMILLSFSYMFNAYAGPVGYILIFGGCESQYLKIQLIVSGIILGCGFVATYYFGSIGYGVATAMGIIVMNVLSIREVNSLKNYMWSLK